LESEIGLLDPIGATPKAFITSSESSVNFSPSIHYWNQSLNKRYYQRRSNSYQAIEFTFCAGGSFGLCSLKEFESGWNARSFMYFVYSYNFGKDCLRNLEPHVSVGWLIYTKRGVFGVYRSFNSNTNLKSFESNRAVVKSNPTSST
jgi:hypothetical protein